ncbi:uncharacterized protein LOC120083720 isoform X1 [Benincasa hispida]|uniref:uncharacterized protein LOC120083720 isoform X1 n=1 Tax=Benincasa hispida TaxID=102211 RepID=UPI0019003EEF|nr:uncharacterized protein LOC120083720 isoform X1 [Benincasa hispida]XP_038895497.1 uncharacterized protein LOC120083720 isoform X1 [Benincasa hispida]XP_038895498.1 uncharacterized protein LOC120083720 isoform X1 [Benincasa hispida]
MALITHHPQGSYAEFSSRLSSWNGSLNLKHCVTSIRTVGRAEHRTPLRSNICLSVGTPRLCGSRPNLLKVSAFKSSARIDDETGGVANGSKIPSFSVKLKDGDYCTETPKANNVPLCYASGANEDIAPSPAIQKLFKKWLELLRRQPVSQDVDGILEDLPSAEMSDTQQESNKKESSEILRGVWFHFLGLNAAVKIPLLIFVPLYLVVNVFYGAEVSRELSPLWVLGPLMTAFYIKMFHWLCALYIFSFKQTAKLIRNSPAYYQTAQRYIIQGKLKEEFIARFMQPIINIKNLDYKEVSQRKFIELREWIVEKYLDFVESIWPYYCRTIRFLKRANLI